MRKRGLTETQMGQASGWGHHTERLQRPCEHTGSTQGHSERSAKASSWDVSSRRGIQMARDSEPGAGSVWGRVCVENQTKQEASGVGRKGPCPAGAEHRYGGRRVGLRSQGPSRRLSRARRTRHWL